MSMPITAKDIAELRSRTGAGMMDCKKALEEAQGDMDKAIAILRTKGIAKAEKRAGRAASEGRIVAVTAADGTSVALVEVNSETDFVSRNDEFGALAQQLAVQVHQDESLDEAVHVAGEGKLLAQPFHADTSKTVEEAVKAASAKTGENVVLRRYARFKTEGALGTYVHFNHKVASLVQLSASSADVAAHESTHQLAKFIAEHIAASAPIAVDRSGVAAEKLESERRIAEEQAREAGKPDAMIDKIATGKVEAFLKDVTLLPQAWVRDPAQTINALIKDHAERAGGTITVDRFARLQLGAE
jgi:elongation factor Ts